MCMYQYHCTALARSYEAGHGRDGIDLQNLILLQFHMVKTVFRGDFKGKQEQL